MALEYVLHARYHGGTTLLGSKTYGYGLGILDPGPDCLSSLEAPFTSETIDASRQRSAFDYFSIASNVYMPGSAGVFPAGSGNAETANRNKQAINRTANFMNNVYFLVGDKVYKWDDDDEAWNVSLVLTGKSTTESNSLGLYPVSVDGRPKLVTAWNTTGGNWRGASLDGLTDTWTIGGDKATISADPSDPNGGILAEHQHDGRIYFLTSVATNIQWFDFTMLDFGIISWAGASNLLPADFCTYNGELYLLNKDVSKNVNIWKIEGSSRPPQFIATFPRSPSAHVGEDQLSALTTASDFEGRCLLYVDSVSDDRAIQVPKLIAYYVTSGFDEKIGTIDDTAHGFSSILYQPQGTGLASFPSIGFVDNPLKMMVNQLGAGEDVVAAKGEGMVIRAHVNQHEKFRSDGEFTANRTVVSVASRFGMYCSTPTPGDGGGDANVLFQHTSLPSGEFAFFAFQKEGRHRAFPHEKIGGGGRISVVDSNGDKIIGMTVLGVEPSQNVDGAVKINYVLHPTVAHPNGTLINTRFFYDPNGHAPETPCELAGTDVGSISGNIIFDIIADSGVIHFVEWKAREVLPNGITNVNLNGVVAVTGVGGGAGIQALSSPKDIPGLALWLDADDVTTISSGTGVSSWGDKSGAGVVGAVTQATSSLQPSYLWGEQNGLNGILFDGSDDYLFAEASPVPTHSMTFMLIYEPKSSMSNKHILSLSNNSGIEVMPGVPVTSFEWASVIANGTDTVVESQQTSRQLLGTSARTATNTSVAIDSPHFLHWSEVEFKASTRVDEGTLVETDFITDGTVFASGLGNTTIGRFTGAQNSGVYSDIGDYANVVVYELAIYSGILNNVDIEAFRLYATNRWGL
jgi:hypothetical protein